MQQQLDIHGQIKRKLSNFVALGKVPHIIFHGPSGSGKKTLVTNFIKSIYEEDDKLVKLYVETVNCAYGKGIKFVREDIKFFAKTNVNATEAGVAPKRHFKSIVLLNADKLTNDAQSALRRCMEIYSETLRIFMVVENKYSLLRPILSRFCEINVPLPMVSVPIDPPGPAAAVTPHQQQQFRLMSINLHKYRLEQTYSAAVNRAEIKRIYNLRIGLQTFYERAEFTPLDLMDYARILYERGYSVLDLIQLIENDQLPATLTIIQKYDMLAEVHNMKKNIRNEAMLCFFVLFRLFPSAPHVDSNIT